MKRFIIMVLLLVYSILFAAPADVTGYKDITWGTSKTKVHELFNSPDYSEQYFAISEFPYYSYTFLDVSSPIQEVKIYFYKDQAFNVVTTYKDNWSKDNLFFNTLTKRLVRDYGDKFEDATSIGDRAWVINSRVWKFNNSVITLSWTRGNNKDSVNIINVTLISTKISDQINSDKQEALEKRVLY